MNRVTITFTTPFSDKRLKHVLSKIEALIAPISVDEDDDSYVEVDIDPLKATRS